MSTGSVLLFGLLFGLQHATEADHLAAVATLVTREGNGRRVIRQGIFWGLGHSLTLLAFGGAVMGLGIVLSDAWVHAMEGAVGLMLVLLGADLLRRIAQTAPLAHSHCAVQQVHDAKRHHPVHRPLPLRALIIGMVHGLAGSAALALLTLNQVGSALLGGFYIMLFGAGSIVGMAALSWAISVPMRLSASRLSGFHRALNIGVALFSVGLGLSVISGNWMS